ncbi:MAG: hypothetical protein B7Z67_12085 [Acidiphilium sp. 21-60-14]|nr:MAG: hypothetical protein B7Z67_12085 [Acidiphilium sp. 21-60-14]OZB39363.1 MAG: hypothetical protein B7X48_09445 [Acidiphilium sp. 34-60-192]
MRRRLCEVRADDLIGLRPWIERRDIAIADKIADDLSEGPSKSAITGTYRAISTKHVPRYLVEFEYRFNRRYDLASIRLASPTLRYFQPHLH